MHFYIHGFKCIALARIKDGSTTNDKIFKMIKKMASSSTTKSF